MIAAIPHGGTWMLCAVVRVSYTREYARRHARTARGVDERDDVYARSSSVLRRGETFPRVCATQQPARSRERPMMMRPADSGPCCADGRDARPASALEWSTGW